MKSLSVKVEVILVVIGFALFTYGKVWGEDWKYIGEAYQGIYFYDTSRMRRPSNGIVKVWIRILYTKKGVNYMVGRLGQKFESLNYAIVLFEYDCGGKKKQILPIAFYSKDGKILIPPDNRISN